MALRPSCECLSPACATVTVGAALAGAFTLGRGPFAAGIAQPAPAQPAVGGEPDLVLLNARVLTSDAGAPRAEAFAVRRQVDGIVGAGGVANQEQPLCRAGRCR